MADSYSSLIGSRECSTALARLASHLSGRRKAPRGLRSLESESMDSMKVLHTGLYVHVCTSCIYNTHVLEVAH